MNYFAGVDGGATKTLCLIGDPDGNILARGTSSASNHQTIGAEAARQAILNSMTQAAKSLGIGPEELSYTVFGLAGADLEPDFAILEPICGDIVKSSRFKVMNDSWIGLKAGIPENWGIVTICGTGASCSGRNRAGKEATLRNLSYETGNYGGGYGLVREAFHYAFRSEEGTGPKTALETEIPALFGRKGLVELLEPAFRMELDRTKAYHIPVVIGRLAALGDPVCQNILLTMGGTLGEIASGVVRKLGMERERFKISLVGGVFKAESPLLIDEYTTAVHRTAPYAQMVVCGCEPAMGALQLAKELYAGETRNRTEI
jgi:N-acetylglucosamine kinase-like BadF-type ATPase